MATWDTIVIGAGIEGSATAYSLVKAGRKTLLLEQFTLPHSRGSSHGHSRIIRKAYAEDFYARMMVEAYDIWKRLEKEEKTQFYIQTGLLNVAKTGHHDLKLTEESLTAINSKFDRLDSATLRRRFPTYSFDASYSAILDPEGGVLLADKCLRAFQNQFKANGGVIRDGEPVLRLIPSANDQVRVETRAGDYLARSVVVAAGPWTNKILQTVGLQLPLQPQRVVVWYWKQLENGYSSTDGFPTFLYFGDDREIYGLPSHEYPGLVKVAYHGGHDLADPDFRDASPVDDRFQRQVSQFVGSHLPGLEAKPSIAETCLYTVTPDDNFILDRHPTYKNIIIGAGFSGHGFKFAPIVGKILSELAAGNSPSYDLSPFKISRFADTKSRL
jgi:sarcosine oxidase / L-pipecolate oxidase